LFGWSANTQYTQFDICNAQNTQYQLFPAGVMLNLTIWYHAVIVQALTQNGLSNYFVYLNGALIGAAYGQVYPISAPRYNSVLGYSNWLDPFWVGEIDTFNVYDQALNQAQVGSLYTTAMLTPAPPPGPLPVISSSSSSSGLSNAAIAGIVLGVVGGVFLCCCVVLLFILCGVGATTKNGKSRLERRSSTSMAMAGNQPQRLEESRGASTAKEVEMTPHGETETHTEMAHQEAQTA